MRKNILLILVNFCSLLSFGQTQVRDEPRHHNVFENDVIRILDVHLGPGDTTLYHLHNTPSVFIIFTNTNIGSQLLGGKPQKGANLTGAITYDSITTARIHRVWNEDTSWFHVMDIELTGSNHSKNITILQNPFLKLLFNEQQANGYSVGLKTGNILELPPAARGYLLVSQTATGIEYKTAGIAQHRLLKPAHYLWVEAGTPLYLKVNNAANFVLLQLK